MSKDCDCVENGAYPSDKTPHELKEEGHGMGGQPPSSDSKINEEQMFPVNKRDLD